MTFEEFQLEVGDGSHILVDGHEHVVLKSSLGLVIARPEGSNVFWSKDRATVDVVQLTVNSWAEHEVEIC
jgi:hypothetical protein